MMHLGDITKISGYDVPPSDVVIGGSPCQDLSIAGKRAGLAGARSGLFMEQIRIIREMREADRRFGRPDHLVRPRFMVWENVPGAFSSNKGQDFQVVLEETIRVAEPNAPDIPLPPKGKWPLADCWYGDGWSVAYRVLDAQFWGVPQRRRRIALVADFGGHTAPEILFERKSVCGDITAGGTPGEETPTGVGSSADKTSKRGGNVPLVFDARGNGDGKTVCTLTGDHQDRVTDYTAIVMATGQSGAEILKELSPTLNCNHEAPIVAGVDCRNGRENGDLCGTLQSNKGSGYSLNCLHPVRVGTTVRRLTPLECERLQGFPDNWTDIGPWTDSKGKLHKESGDSARYKALGNSIALPPWTWVLKRLCGCYERPATMASLFDGIGGFPLIWEKLNGPGTCLWASEIEEFPIAVTKRHFPHASDERRF